MVVVGAHIQEAQERAAAADEDGREEAAEVAVRNPGRAMTPSETQKALAELRLAQAKEDRLVGLLKESVRKHQAAAAAAAAEQDQPPTLAQAEAALAKGSASATASSTDPDADADADAVTRAGFQAAVDAAVAADLALGDQQALLLREKGTPPPARTPPSTHPHSHTYTFVGR